mmetsp:Transcript_5529/g.9741  ORF Transcript_5529/g.9741 Transcript_5529/m.9741 type:complete len:121 (+) Transcript_5529:100-462(+)
MEELGVEDVSGGELKSSVSYWGLSQEATANSRLRRIAVIGARGVGKSRLTIRLCEDYFDDAYIPTIEDSYQTSLKIDGNQYVVEIIDTAGQDYYSIFGSHVRLIHSILLCKVLVSRFTNR